MTRYAGHPPLVARVALVADAPDWVFARLAGRVAAAIGGQAEVTILFSRDLAQPDDMARTLFDVDPPYTLVHFFWRHALADLFHPRTWARLVLRLDDDAVHRIQDRIAATRKTTWVCDHLFLGDELAALWNRRTLRFASRYGVSSRMLGDRYAAIMPGQSAHALQDGVDLARFRPRDDPPRTSPGRPMLVGWAGNSAWGGENADHKGLHGIIRPAVARLARENLARARFRDSAQEAKPFDEMPGYYRSLDIFTCASIDEGTPNTLLEAMACALPVVTTRVGIVDEVFGPLQRAFIVEPRSVAGFEQALRRLAADEDLRRRIGQENLERVQSWDWSRRIENWRTFLTDALAAPVSPCLCRAQRLALDDAIAIARNAVSGAAGSPA